MPKWPTVLIIDDRPETVDYLTYSLGKLGANVVYARSAEEGLEKARANRPDLIGCDWRMPTMDGMSFGRAVLADGRLRGIPMILLTDKHPEDEDYALAEECGYRTIIYKPLNDPHAFARMLMAFLK